jgi:hypothetical protein
MKLKNQIASLDSENLNVINAQEAAAEQADSIKQGLDFLIPFSMFLLE